MSIPAVIHPVSGAVVDPKFREARIKPPAISEVSSTHAVNALLDTGNDIDILLQEPFAEEVSAVSSDVVKNLNHNTYIINRKRAGFKKKKLLPDGQHRKEISF